MAKTFNLLTFGTGGGGDFPFNVTNFTGTALDDTITLKWTDPSETDAPDWIGTKIVIKKWSYPTHENDGTAIVDSMTRNQFQTVGFDVTGLEEGVTYYPQAFPYSRDGISNNVANRIPPITINFVHPLPLVSFSIASGNGELTPVFTLPYNATSCRIVYKTGSMPSNILDGTVIEPAISGTPITGLVNDETYYFRAFPRNEFGRYNEEIEGNTSTGVPGEIFEFTYTGDYEEFEDTYDGVDYYCVKLLTSGTFVSLSDAVIDAFILGGGGGGGYAGGGGGYTTTALGIGMVADTSYLVSIGAGGAKATTPGGNAGGTTTAFGHAANGGAGGKGTTPYYGGNGGSGGGGAGSNQGAKGGAGGSDGADGATGYPGSPPWIGGTGQHTTTRAFGALNGELFGGGGGGGGGTATTQIAFGGEGGGGNGGMPGVAPLAGVTNRGGGGGGLVSTTAYGAAGGSGIVIVRWPV